MPSAVYAAWLIQILEIEPADLFGSPPGLTPISMRRREADVIHALCATLRASDLCQGLRVTPSSEEIVADIEDDLPDTAAGGATGESEG